MSHRSEYEIIRESGRGGLGIVHQARHEHYDDFVALKELQDHCKDKDEYRARFLREMRIARKLRHPNIVESNLDYSEKELFFIMEYIDAPDLWDVLEHDHILSEDETIHVGLQLADALAYMHGKNILHRDIKPDNVFLVDNRVKLFDFSLSAAVGASRLTEPGVFLGTPGYVSPSTITQAKDPSFADDVYALGATLFSVCTGRVPFQEDGDELDCLTAQIRLDLPSPKIYEPELSEEFAKVICGMGACNEEDRYQSMTQVLAALRLLLQKEKMEV